MKKIEAPKIGFELEFVGSPPGQIATAIGDKLNSQIKKINKYQYICESALGEFRVESDSDSLRKRRYESPLNKVGIQLAQNTSDSIARWLIKLSSVIVPFELVCPPIDEKDLSTLEQLCSKCQKIIESSEEMGSIFTPCGLHINRELLEFNPQYIVNIMRAFCIRYQQAVQNEEIDRVRRLSGYIEPYSKKYQQLLFQKTYFPGIEELIKDYLKYNPTRNSALDMLPLFRYLKPKLVEKKLHHELEQIKARPTFHYRLENCHLDDPQWSLREKWEKWQFIETLAEMPSEQLMNYHTK